MGVNSREAVVTATVKAISSYLSKALQSQRDSTWGEFSISPLILEASSVLFPASKNYLQELMWNDADVSWLEMTLMENAHRPPN